MGPTAHMGPEYWFVTGDAAALWGTAVAILNFNGAACTIGGGGVQTCSDSAGTQAYTWQQ